MVGQRFQIVFSQKAKRRLQSIFDFEELAFGTKKAQRVFDKIDSAIDSLSQLPASRPIYIRSVDETIYRYVKGYDYKVIFQVYEQSLEVLIVTIRHDAEDPEIIRQDLV